MIDWARVSELREEIGTESFAEVVDLFLEEVDAVITRLRTVSAPVSLDADLHFLKGSAWNLGFEAFGALCQSGEKIAASGDPAAVDLNGILDSYDRSRAAFLAGLGDLAA